jgi:ATP-binding cassette, subfamily B, bacterial PglK
MKRSILKRVTDLLSVEERRKGMILIFLLTAASILDVFSIASLLPVVLLIISPVDLSDNSPLGLLYKTIGFTSRESFGITLALTAFMIIIIKTRLAILVTAQKASYAYGVANTRAMRAVDNFFGLSFPDFARSDFGVELNRVTNIPLVFANNILIPAGTIYSEGVVCFLLFLAIAIADPLLLLFTAALFLPVIAIYHLQKSAIRRSSDNIKQAYPEVVRNSIHAIQAYPEIRSFNKHSFFRLSIENAYKRLTRIFALDHTRNTTLGRISELAAGLVVCAIIIYILLFRPSQSQALVLLTLYAGISFRAIPSVNRIISSAMQIRANEFSIEEMERLPEMKPMSHGTLDGPSKLEESIELNDIAFTYNGSDNLLDGVNLVVNKGEKILITGNSGSGKTTLLLILMRLVYPTRGMIRIDGKVVQQEHNSFGKLIGYVGQNPTILNASINENIAFGCPAEERDEPKIATILRDLQLEAWVKSLERKGDTLIGENGASISGGQRQRIALARALYFDTEVFLLDESTNQIQEDLEKDIWELFNVYCLAGKTLITVSHQRSTKRFFDRHFTLRDGKLVETTVTSPATSTL